MTGNVVRAMDNAPARVIDFLYDRETGDYAAPYYDPATPRGIEQARAGAEQLSREIQQATRIAGFGDNPSLPSAVLDTGMMSHHPLLRNRIVAQKDFTGEGPEDLNGHGTVVALIHVASDPSAELMNVKVLGKDKTGKEEHLIAGIEWAAENGALSIGMSLGIERECDGGCALCTVVKRLGESGIHVSIAAGNKPHGQFCPANCRGQAMKRFEINGRYIGDVSRISVVGALDYSGLKRADYSPSADRYAPGTVRLVRLKRLDNRANS